MRLLVLGGTRFVGRALVADALRRGHTVTTFTRGVSGDPPEGVEALHGDRTRTDDLAVLDGRGWDAVVDTSGYVPAVVGAGARRLAGRVGTYVYVSSCSVYPEIDKPVDESSKVFACDPDATEGEYGELKAGCERAVEQAFPDAALHVRAGLILGPYEDVGRLPWWLARMARGGEVLAPGPRDRALQYIDARDLAVWMLDRAEAGDSGPYDVTSPTGHATMASLLGSCREVTGGRAELSWVDPELLLAQGVGQWHELPLWVAPDAGLDGLYAVGVDKALATGLTCRPVEETVSDTWQWLREVGAPPQRPDRPPPGIDPAKEREVLDVWSIDRSA